jgi:Phage derived protein Gp49-like (DUF891)
LPDVSFFRYTPEGRDVVAKFISRDLKRHREAQTQLVQRIQILEQTPLATLRERQHVEFVEGEILSYKFSTGSLWIRLLMACWPDDRSIVILLPLVKKRNRLDRADIDESMRNLRMLKERQKTQ